MRLIDADELKKKFIGWLPKEGTEWLEGDFPPLENLSVSAIMEIEEAPTIEAVPVVHGEWIYENYTWHCDVCGFHPYKGYIPKEPSNFCPNCGAKMDRGDCSD